MMKEHRIPLETAEAIANEIVALLLPYCERIEIAGSIRRRSPFVGDIKIVCLPILSQPWDGGGYDIWQRLRELRGTGELVPRSDRRERVAWSERYIRAIYIQHNAPVDIFIANALNWGYILAVRTGSAVFSQLLAIRWVSLGYNGTGGFLMKEGRIIPVPEEEDLFRLLALEYVPPAERNIPDLVW
jgi:DNA polymerase/3'-5' exonuclease PolX